MALQTNERASRGVQRSWAHAESAPSRSKAMAASATAAVPRIAGVIGIQPEPGRLARFMFVTFTT